MSKVWFKPHVEVVSNAILIRSGSAAQVGLQSVQRLRVAEEQKWLTLVVLSKHKWTLTLFFVTKNFTNTSENLCCQIICTLFNVNIFARMLINKACSLCLSDYVSYETFTDINFGQQLLSVLMRIQLCIKIITAWSGYYQNYNAFYSLLRY